MDLGTRSIRRAVLNTLSFIALAAFAVDASAAAREAKLPKNALPVPLVAQATDYSCGAAALLSVLYYWQEYDGTESSLYPLLSTTPEDGTHPIKMTEVAGMFNLKASMRERMTVDDLKAALKKGDTIILDIQAWSEGGSTPWKDRWEDGHYVVLVGMDSHFVYVMDPSAHGAYGYFPLSELIDRWHDYEDRDGYVQKYFQLGIVIRGKDPLKKVPGPLIRIE